MSERAPTTSHDAPARETPPQAVARRALGALLLVAGVSHLTVARRAFRAQVPDWVPLDVDTTVVASGLAEVALGAALVLAGERRRVAVGRVAAAFFVAVFPGNVSQYVHRRSAFGLDTDRKRLVRLFGQPALVCWALRSTRRHSERDTATRAVPGAEP